MPHDIELSACDEGFQIGGSDPSNGFEYPGIEFDGGVGKVR